MDAFHASLVGLVPELRPRPDRTRTFSDGLARSVLWAALTQDSPDVVEATFQNVGSEYLRQGFPADGYHAVGHALLRSSRLVYPGDWSSELSSGWVAYYGWLGTHLERGAANGPARQPATTPPPAAAPPPVTSPAVTPPAVTPPAVTPSAVTPSARPAPSSSPDPSTAPLPMPRPIAAPAPIPAQSQPIKSAPIQSAPIQSAPIQSAAPPSSDQPGPAPQTGQFPVISVPLETPAGSQRESGQRESGQRESGPGRSDERGYGLSDVLDGLRTQYFQDDTQSLATIVTRVALRTGADLRTAPPDQATHPAVIADVLIVLEAIGYPLTSRTDDPDPDDAAGPELDPDGRWWVRRGPGPSRGWRRSRTETIQ